MAITKHFIALCSAAVLATACDEAETPVAPDITPAFAAAPKTVLPNGQKLGTLIDSSGHRTRNRIEYHGGPVMAGTSAVYLIWYGAWAGDSTPALIANLATSIGSSAYINTITYYRDFTGAAPNGAFIYAGSRYDPYSRGTSLRRADVDSIVISQLRNLGFIFDPYGIYFVLASADVAVVDLEQRTCAFHGASEYYGKRLNIAYVGSPVRMPTVCVPQNGGPNGNTNGDAMASLFAAELANAATDPSLTSYYDKLGYEMADKCAWKYGTTFTAPNGARANIKLGQRYYLLQQLWLPEKSGGRCVLAAP